MRQQKAIFIYFWNRQNNWPRKHLQACCQSPDNIFNLHIPAHIKHKAVARSDMLSLRGVPILILLNNDMLEVNPAQQHDQAGWLNGCRLLSAGWLAGWLTANEIRATEHKQLHSRHRISLIDSWHRKPILVISRWITGINQLINDIARLANDH